MHLEKVFGKHGRIPGADIMTWKKKIRNISETSEQIQKVTIKNESTIKRFSIFRLPDDGFFWRGSIPKEW